MDSVYLDLSALVLAAGKSTRIRPVSGGCPKPLIELAGESLIGRNLRWLAAAGLRHTWINLHYRGDEIRAHVGDGRRFGLDVGYSEEPELLGTAGALKKLEPTWGEEGIVVYGDNLFSFDLARMRDTHRVGGSLVTIALFDQDYHVNTGIAGGRVVVDADGRVTDFVEGVESGSSLVNAGVYMLSRALLAEMEPGTFLDFGRDVFPRLLARGRSIRAYLLEPEGYCLGLDTPESYAAGVRLISSGRISAL